MSHPYKEFEKTPLCNIIYKAIEELVENDDLDQKSSRKYIVGYICKLLNESKFLNS
ncbi:hypothetical protein HPT25_16650 [Bacillus sp. BRMEA1]|uniref:hypothetical protein n=1 Tax=Neobacillus endophyticus TaxID=2738405 RepID=UPI001563E59D|nr:hypothetical protein [Neobacillus endophyticus]NRD78996.1 hypothetical protein [Neobacillus endophyticus]